MYRSVFIIKIITQFHLLEQHKHRYIFWPCFPNSSLVLFPQWAQFCHYCFFCLGFFVVCCLNHRYCTFINLSPCIGGCLLTRSLPNIYFLIYFISPMCQFMLSLVIRLLGFYFLFYFARLKLDKRGAVLGPWQTIKAEGLEKVILA